MKHRSGRGHIRQQRGEQEPGLGRDRGEDLSEGAAAPRHARLPAFGVGVFENPLPTLLAAAGSPSGIQTGVNCWDAERMELLDMRGHYFLP